MSMNLKCNELELWHTPSYITYMRMSYNENYNPMGGMQGVRQ